MTDKQQQQRQESGADESWKKSMCFEFRLPSAPRIAAKRKRSASVDSEDQERQMARAVHNNLNLSRIQGVPDDYYVVVYNLKGQPCMLFPPGFPLASEKAQ